MVRDKIFEDLGFQIHLEKNPNPLKNLYHMGQ